jgi:hypothetical protein
MQLCKGYHYVAIIMLMVLSIFRNCFAKRTFLILHDSSTIPTSLEARTTSGNSDIGWELLYYGVISIVICATEEQKKAPTALPWQGASNSESDGSKNAELEFPSKM